MTITQVRRATVYRYEDERPWLFTEEGQVMFLKIRDTTKSLLRVAGAFRATKAFIGVGGDSWHMFACLDRLVELGELKKCVGYASPFADDEVFTI